MGTVADSTAYNDCREALRAEIKHSYNDNVVGSQWATKVPSATPPDGYAAEDTKWTQTLRNARKQLIEQGYALSEITLVDGQSVLDLVLNASVRLLFEKITANRVALRNGGRPS